MRLNQITAPAHDLAASIAFYETLGLILIVRSDHYARFECPRGDATFSLHLVDGPIPQANGVQIYFETLDVAEEVARLKQAGLAFESETQDQRWLWREAWLRDPAGNRIGLYHAGENRRMPPWRVGVPETPAQFHLVIRDGGAWVIAKLGAGQDWRALQEEYADFKTSLGPYDLRGLLTIMEIEWPDLRARQHDAITAFASSAETRLVF